MECDAFTDVSCYRYNNAFQPTSAKDPARTSFYASGALYAPHGALSGMVNGNVPGGQPGATTTNSYNNRLLPATLSAASSISVLNLSYNYFSNGLVQQITNNRDNPNRPVGTVSFTYDALNRVGTTQTPGTDCSVINGLTKNWGNSYEYDRFGNLKKKTQTKCMAENLNVTVDGATNRLTPVTDYSYDAAGNLLTDGLGHSYTYNAESKLTTSGSTTFTYDGDGVRVKKSGWRMYWTGMGTEVLEESDLSGVMQKEYIYFAGRRVGFRSVPTDTIYYYFSDHLGSANVITNGSGSSIQAESDFFPFGGERVIINLINNRYEFTGKEIDTANEGGLTHFLFREYTTNLGRFMSPDPLAGDISNPQSLNRYAYVLNNPANFVDPLGLCEISVTRQDADGTIRVICLDPEDREHRVPNDARGSGPGSSGGCSVSMGGVTLNFAACSWMGGRSGRERPFREKVKEFFKRALHKTNCALAAPLIASATTVSGTTGAGVGGSFGLGFFLGASGTGSLLVVADQHKNVGLMISAGGNPGSVPVVFGAGAQGGRQVMASSARTIFDLRGPWVGGSGSVGPLGVNVSISEGGTTATVTSGPGFLGKYSGSEGGNTWVPQSFTFNCSDVF